MSAWRRSLIYSRRYVGNVKACILDWSGTTADKYVLAPAVVFREVFACRNVPISMPEARGPMGLRKDLHIAAILKNTNVKARWREEHGRDPNSDDVSAMFADFVPKQLDCLKKYADLIPGTAEAIDNLKGQGVKIGCTTGFTKDMVDVLLREAAAQGYTPDASVAGDEVINGARPNPHMLYRNLDLLNVSPIQSVVKVDDTVSGVEEALEAGCWGVGVTRYSNYMDIDSFDHEQEITAEEMMNRNKKSHDILAKSGAHYVIDSIKDLPDVVADINSRLSRGEQP